MSHFFPLQRFQISIYLKPVEKFVLVMFYIFSLIYSLTRSVMLDFFVRKVHVVHVVLIF